jgi:hypothetical protein
MKPRVFSKPLSVWATWKDDDYSMIKKCLDHDFRHWKGNRFIKDRVDLNSLQLLIRDNMSFLKA